MLSGNGYWHTGALVTNPSNGEVLVDTGPMQVVRASYWLVGVMSYATANAVFDLQLRSADNTTTLQQQRRGIDVSLRGRNDDMILFNKIPVNQEQRLRCVLVGAVVGEVQLSLFRQEM